MAYMSATKPGLPLAVSVGEPAGIGAEIIAKAWLLRRDKDLPPFYVVGDPAFVRSRLARAGLAAPLDVTTPEAASDVFADSLPVFDLGHPVEDRPGELSGVTAAATIAAIETAVRHVRGGRACAAFVHHAIHYGNRAFHADRIFGINNFKLSCTKLFG